MTNSPPSSHGSDSVPYSMQVPIGISQLPSGPSGCNTLIGCFNHLSLNSSKSRFPAPPRAEPSPIGTRDEQRRIYHGPKLSDRATGGPDAGPLIERFSCLFKDREYTPTPIPSSSPCASASAGRLAAWNACAKRGPAGRISELGAQSSVTTRRHLLSGTVASDQPDRAPQGAALRRAKSAIP